MTATGNKQRSSGAGQVSSGGAGPVSAGFPVWVELRCSRCPEQIVGRHVDAGPVPHAWLSEAARSTGAVRVGSKWVCFSCVRQAARLKAAGQGAEMGKQVLAFKR